MAARPRFASRQQAFAASAALNRGIAAAGGHEALASRLGIGAAALRSWLHCPAARVRDVAAATGVPAHELRPDLFPAPAATPRNDAEQATAAHLAAGQHFALTGRTLSSERH
ncbi:DNA-binding transcriptional regulator YdaS (Cro superfamily) [Methylorubrum extorquens]